MEFDFLDARPIIVAVAGSNGAGKTTFYDTSVERVSMRVAQGGHDVPDDKLQDRFHRTLENLQRAIDKLPHVLVYDNSDLSRPYQHVATYRNGKTVDHGNL